MKGSWKALLKRWVEAAFPLDADEFGAMRHPAELRFGLPNERPRRHAPGVRQTDRLDDRLEREAWFPPPAA